MNEVKKYRFFFILFSGLIILTFINFKLGWKAFEITGTNILNMLFLLPPVLLFVSLLDKWVEKETLIKYMGKKSGLYGTFFSLLLGVIAAGPLYVAFPMAVLFLKKGASIRYIVFFLGVWTTAKLPTIVYEIASFGVKFTLIHICFGLVFYYVLGMIYEKFYDGRQLLKFNIKENTIDLDD
ncbi:permease [Bacillus sp. RG28]|uniref:Permease n=1 Tax=Gottfriedia endophytica TaxID=2820819 RepID=A0A940NDU9_9BACI|nr:permease [Gottfriedia endophytica]MBP0723684.1 permease [Gottfriedia endophytica]